MTLGTSFLTQMDILITLALKEETFSLLFLYQQIINLELVYLWGIQ